MNNYICIEGKKVELSEETIKNFKEQLGIKSKITYEDVAKSLFGSECTYYISGNQGNIVSSNRGVFTTADPNNATSRKQLQKLLAINKLMNVAKYLNGDWKPDWSNGFKYYIHLNSNEKCSLEVFSTRDSNKSIVYFKSKRLALEAIKVLGEDEIRLALCTDY